MSLLSLPLEILGEIFYYLSARDILSASLGCRLLHEASKLDYVWSMKCWTDFKLRVPAGNNQAYKLYTQILWKYGNLLGLWKAHADCYGGLLQVKYADWSIVGTNWDAPQNPHISNPLRANQLFEVKLDSSGPVCTMKESKRHPCSLTYRLKQLKRDSPATMVFTRRCQGDADHHETVDTTQEMSQWMADQNDFQSLSFVAHELLIYKFIVMKQFESCANYTRLDWPRVNFPVPMQPGLFKGTYSVHGIELIMLEYDSEGNKVQGVKITGDKNVPAGQVTFRADLPYCMALTLEEQESLDELSTIEPSMSSVPWNELPATQPFHNPREVSDRFSSPPSKCRARFHGFGQVAEDGFRHPSFIPGHWVVFSEDLFGFLWFQLSSFSMYHRVKENLTSFS